MRRESERGCQLQRGREGWVHPGEVFFDELADAFLLHDLREDLALWPKRPSSPCDFPGIDQLRLFLEN